MDFTHIATMLVTLTHKVGRMPTMTPWLPRFAVISVHNSLGNELRDKSVLAIVSFSPRSSNGL